MVWGKGHLITSNSSPYHVGNLNTAFGPEATIGEPKIQIVTCLKGGFPERLLKGMLKFQTGWQTSLGSLVQRTTFPRPPIWRVLFFNLLSQLHILVSSNHYFICSFVSSMLWRFFTASKFILHLPGSRARDTRLWEVPFYNPEDS